VSGIEPLPPTVVDRDEADACYRDWSRPLIRFLLGVTGDIDLAEDAMQAGWSKLLPQWGEVRPEARRSWLFTTCYRDALANRRRKKTATKHLDKLTAIREHAEKTMQTPAAQAEHAEQLTQLRRVLDHLPPGGRQVVRLRLKGLTFQEVADTLGLPLSTAISRMHAAMRDLRIAMKGDRDAE